jgi:adenosine deaminase
MKPRLPPDEFIRGLPKAELHIHIEGSLEPELMFELARRNGVPLSFDSVEAVRRAFRFENLQSFLDLYYQGMKVLLKEADFFDLTWSYLEKAQAQNIRHAEIFFDPQAHTSRGVSFETVLSGIDRALRRGESELGLTTGLILCFLRDRSAEEARDTLKHALPFKQRILGVGLDSAERGHPPEKFTAVFEEALQEGLRTVAHAGEEGPPDYIWQALDRLRVSRIDHGVRCLEDPKLVERLAREGIPLTVCPLSNVRLGVFRSMEEHNLKKLLESGLVVTVNSDDPAYFGGYVNENFLAAREGLRLSGEDIAGLARNSFQASFLPTEVKKERVAELERFVAGYPKGETAP